MTTILQHGEATRAFDADAPVARVFPLFGPVEERRWAPGWDPELLHLVDDGVGVGTVFRTRAGAGGDVIWVLADYDATAHQARYVRVAPLTHAGTIAVRCEAQGADRTRVTVRYALTSLTPVGDDYVRAFFADGAYDRFIDGWRDAVASALA
jgi:hypothetical protein